MWNHIYYVLIEVSQYIYSPTYYFDCSEIYCHGELLHDVQTSGVFGDGTVFVEKRLLYSEKEVVEKYKKLKQKLRRTPSVQQLRKFVDENFANDSLPACDFPDFTRNPSILKKTDKAVYKKWLTDLNEIWLQLGGRLHEDVKKYPERHSYLYIPNRFVKAGGRFTGTKTPTITFANLLSTYIFSKY